MHREPAGALSQCVAVCVPAHTHSSLHLRMSVGKLASKCQLREKHWKQLEAAEVVQFCLCAKLIGGLWGRGSVRVDQMKACTYKC